ncbi:class I SAM-dependent methyltransferase [Candidatus Woesearchaeota archaeon]|nr:class I SAM-dependent methyltransferase [Candidatus Woesearchaeota archaeon]
MSHYYHQHQSSRLRLAPITVKHGGQNLNLSTASGVFSYGKLDKGTKVLITYARVHENDRILDMGCGYGVIGITFAKTYPHASVVLLDINERAVQLAEKNIKANNVTNAVALQSDLYSGLQANTDQAINTVFDTVLTNPPQSAGKSVCFQIIEQAPRYLRLHGSLQLVARRHKGGNQLAEKMKAVFGNLQVLVKKGGYWLYYAEKTE